MHASDEQLLDILDNNPVAADMKQHVSFCMLCRDRQDELSAAADELRLLPGCLPQTDLWPGVLARINAERVLSAGHRRLSRPLVYVLAASVVLALTLYLAHPGSGGPARPHETMTAVVPPVEAPAPVNESETAAAVDNLDVLINQSAYLESVLDALPRRPRVMRASTTDLISGLQDGVALIDYQLNNGRDALTVTQARTLWRQRVDLMNSLVYVRAAEAQQVAYIPN